MVWWRAARPLRLITARTYSDIRSSYIPFENAVKARQLQARKSILIQVNSEMSYSELHSYCSQFGSILGVHHYTLPNNQQNFMLVEFDSEEEASQLISSTCFADDVDVIPVHSPFLWFRAPQSKSSKSRSKDDLVTIDGTSLTVKNGCRIPQETTIMNALSSAENVSEQIELLYKMTKLNDLETRLRYLTARQIECAFMGLFPRVSVYPFGSSVNGYGKMGCDLDLVMKLTTEDIKENVHSRLVFHAKKSVANGRYQQQRYMELVSDMIQLFVPGCSHVVRILQARIPIIKYNQDYTGLECDLSMSSLSGLYMSEVLYLFGCFDSRVKPLIFTIRKWAQFAGLTNPSPGKWITNFPLTLMVLFFLQNAPEGAILPTYNTIKNYAGKNDVRITDDSVNCTYARDIEKIPFRSPNQSSLEELLMQFFEFYSDFDFSSNSISINDGRTARKIDYSALYIINPLEVGLNVSKNVSLEECERMRIEFRNALWMLQSNLIKSEQKWGLTQLLNKQSVSEVSRDHKRMVVMKDLFEESDKSESTENLNENSGEVEPKPRITYDFKSADIKNQVEGIKKEYANNMRRINNLLNSDEPKDDNTLTNRRKVRRR